MEDREHTVYSHWNEGIIGKQKIQKDLQLAFSSDKNVKSQVEQKKCQKTQTIHVFPVCSSFLHSVYKGHTDSRTMPQGSANSTLGLVCLQSIHNM